MTSLELAKINQDIENLKLKKIEVKEQLKKDGDVLNKNKNHYNNSPNDLKRVSSKFCNEIDNINDKREEIGFGKLSNPKITELIIRHKWFKAIKEDIIHFNIELEGKK
jgi:FtsZ-binding cell division protein ZapB